MKNILTVEPISALSTNMWKFRILTAAIKLNVFDVVQNIPELKEIAGELELERDPLERLLNALVAMELLERKEDSYFNRPISAKFLVKTSKEYYGDFILMNEGMDDSWRELDRVIRTNSPVAGDNRKRLTKEVFTRGMHNNAQAPANAISRLVDFTNRKHLLDIGGGSGAFSIILTNNYGGLKATVNEQPVVCKTVREYVDKEGNNNKIDILEGDYFKVEFPVHDVALFAQIFHTNSVDQNKFLLEKVHEKMQKNGMVIITEFLLDENRTGPLFPALFNLNMLKQTKNGRAYIFSEIESWLEDTGFKTIDKRQLVGPHTVITADK